MTYAPLGSIATRLALTLALVMLVVLSAVGSLLHWSLEHELLRAENEELEGKADVVRHFIDEVQSRSELPALGHHLDDALIGNGVLRVWIVSADGQVIYGGKSAPPTQPADGGHLSITREDGVPLMGMRYAMPAGSILPEAQVLIGLDTRPRRALMRTYDRAAAFVCALGMVVTISLCVWVARRGLLPLKRLSAEAANITPSALSRRLSTHVDTLELAPLVKSFNHALDRVEDAYRQLESFSADVAHELRTPLAVLISGAEVTLSRTRPTEELQNALALQLEELRALASMINDMLFLAHADRGVPAESLVDVSLQKEAFKVSDYLEASMEVAGLLLRIDGDMHVRANPALVRRALVNLVVNAVRHTPAGESIVVRFDEANGWTRVSVCNPGPPIPGEVRAHMFDRFWRGDASRTESTEHHGLGLAIVRAVARMHGGDTFASSQAGTTTVGFTLRTD